MVPSWYPTLLTTTCLSDFHDQSLQTDKSVHSVAYGKSVTFIRHGRSAGNAHVYGMLEKRDVYAYRDCQLVQDGERQAADLVASLDSEGLSRITDAQVVLISPLARAMATAVLVLAQAWNKSRSTRAWPRVEVVMELREKVKSDSERPGTNAEDSLIYVRRVAQAIGERLFGDTSIMEAVVDDISRSYQAERQRSNNWRPEPIDANSFMSMIEEFKEKLEMRAEQTYLLVGHSGWARFAFSAFLPCSDKEIQFNNLQAGARETCTLRNCDMVYVNFKRRMFQDALFCGSALDLSSSRRREGKRVSPILSLEEAKIARVVPDDARMVRMRLHKRMKSDSFKMRIFTFSSSGEAAHLAWADKWGKPKGSIPINTGRLVCTRDWRSCTFYLSYSTLDTDKVMQLRASSVDEFDKFLALVEQFRNHPRSSRGSRVNGTEIHDENDFEPPDTELHDENGFEAPVTDDHPQRVISL